MSVEITCNHFFDGTELHGATRVIFENSIVASIEPMAEEGEFHLISPGLVDIQMNGFDSRDVSRSDAAQLCELDEQLARAGTTTWLATVVTAPLEALTGTLNVLHQSLTHEGLRGCAGIHLEGPFLGAAAGAHRPDWIIPFDGKWLEQLPQSVKLITVGAELATAESTIASLANRGIRISLGHTSATHAQLNQCKSAGASMVTHLFNGMSGVHHREGGVALWALTTDDLFVGLISDGVHCSAEAVSLVFRTKSVMDIVLVSDSIAWNSAAAKKRGISLVNGVPRLPSGTIAGSSASLAQCIAFAVRESGVPLAVALRAATSNPARAMGLTDVGTIQVGSSADLVAFDAQLSVVNTWRRLQSECA